MTPTAETIADGEYPLSRTLYIYVNKAKAADNAAVAAFVDYYLADGTISTALETVPYVNLPADELAATRDCLGSQQVALLLLEPAGPAGRSGRFTSPTYDWSRRP